MKRGNSSNWVHWLYAVRTGTSTSTNSVTVLTVFPFVVVPRLAVLPAQGFPDLGRGAVFGFRRQARERRQNVVGRVQIARPRSERVAIGGKSPAQVAAEA